MIRPERCCRKMTLAFFTTEKVPFMCTAMTSSHSCSDMLKIIRSRSIPATVTTMSSFPKLSRAVWTILSPPAMVATDSRQATPSPPSALISSTTCWAKDESAPVPSTLTPGSTTTTLAPWAAISLATPRPMPRPEPVMIATLSFSRSAIRFSPSGYLSLFFIIRGRISKPAPTTGSP